MLKTIIVTLLATMTAAAEIHTLTMRQAVDRAVRQNPEMIATRLNEQRAEQQIRIARDPFIPKVFVGSGLAYTSGFPMSIEGSAPSILQAKGIASIINRPERHRLHQAKEEANGAVIETTLKRGQIVMETVELYLRAENAAETAKSVRAQAEGLKRVAEMLSVRESEGRELPIEVKRAQLDVARARQRIEVFDSEQMHAEGQLAMVLGYEPGDQVRTTVEGRDLPELPDTAEAAVASALDDNAEVRRLESSLISKGFQIKAAKSERLPRLSLVAQYGLFSKFNNYEDYFNRFERHNGQLGISFEVPVYAGAAAKARRAQAEIESDKLRAELTAARSRIALNTRKSYQDLKKAETGVSVARLDLELARDEVGIQLSRLEEGRASLKEVDAARYVEHEKWISYHDSHYILELARYRLLGQTGALTAVLLSR